jgi:AraC family transcriptional regulator of adaptative response/methylated-DNA-[protein]-cysteine methyltransferase
MLPKNNLKLSSKDYIRIEQAILFIERNFRKQPDLKEIAKSVHLSEYHFQRLFRRWAGISPKQFLKLLTIEYAKKLLQESRSLLEVTYKSGLSSPGRLHDLFVTVDAVTPGEFKRKGERLKITYGFHSTPFGECLLSVTDRGICGLSFITQGERQGAIKSLKNKWSRAELVEDPNLTQTFVDQVFVSSRKENKPKLNLFLKGTNFQIKVWEALLMIPSGFILSYQDVANLIRKPDAVRAVANAVSMNPIAYIIPCHRVIRKIGIIGDYRWGTVRKQAIIGWEAIRRRETTVDRFITTPDNV